MSSPPEHDNEVATSGDDEVRLGSDVNESTEVTVHTKPECPTSTTIRSMHDGVGFGGPLVGPIPSAPRPTFQPLQPLNPMTPLRPIVPPGMASLPTSMPPPNVNSNLVGPQNLQGYGTVSWPESDMKHLVVPVEVPSRQITLVIGGGLPGEPGSRMVTMSAPLGWVWIPMGVVFDNLPEGTAAQFPNGVPVGTRPQRDMDDGMQVYEGMGPSMGMKRPGMMGEGEPSAKRTNARLRFRCEHEGCSYGTYFRADYQKHLYTHSTERPFTCPHEGCEATFKQKQSVDNHHRNHHSNKPLHPCSFEGCTYETVSVPTLKQHMLRHTGEKPHRCSYDGCGKNFRSKSACTGHETLHMRDGKYTCDACGFKFGDFTLFRAHVRNHLPPNFTMCPHHGCVDAFDNPMELDKHINVCKFKGGLITNLQGGYMS